MIKNDIVFVLDFDGVFTDGKMYYSPEGKVMKTVGSDDFDLIKKLSNYIQVQIITADERGLSITSKRIKEEMGLKLDLVKGNPKQRWNWIKNKYITNKIIFMGDSLNDYYSLKKADLSITVADALPFTKKCADFVSKRKGGDRAVADAIIFVGEYCGLFNEEQILNA